MTFLVYLMDITADKINLYMDGSPSGRILEYTLAENKKSYLTVENRTQGIKNLIFEKAPVTAPGIC